MALRRLVSKAIFPTLERDLSASIGQEMAAVDEMLNNMLAPQVFGYDKPSSGAIRGTTPLHSPGMIKVTYPSKPQGLFDE
jgi:hypothetical protein